MSKRKKEEVKKKDTASSVIIFLIIVVILGGLVLMVSHESSVNEGNHIKEITYREYKDKINSSDYTIVLLATPTCSHCMAYKPLMNKVANEYNLEINYVNVSSSGMTNDEYNELHDSISVLKDVYSDGYPVIPTPTTILFKDGKEVAAKTGNIKDTGFLDFLKSNGVIS